MRQDKETLYREFMTSQAKKGFVFKCKLRRKKNNGTLIENVFILKKSF